MKQYEVEVRMDMRVFIEAGSPATAQRRALARVEEVMNRLTDGSPEFDFEGVSPAYDEAAVEVG